MATEITYTTGFSSVTARVVPDVVDPPRPGALSPLANQFGVRDELVDDALAFMEEYDDVFRSLAQ